MKFKAKVGEVMVDLTAEPETLISILKTNVEQITGVSSSCQKWIYQGKILSGDVTVKAAGIIEGNVVHVVKSAQSATPVQGLNNSVPQTGVPFVPPIANQQSISIFDLSIKKLLLNTEEEAKVAVTTLSKIVRNIIDNPQEEKFRKLKNSNAAFQKKLLSLGGGPDCLKALGFTLVGEEWILVPTSDAWDLLVYSKDKLERFISQLEAVKSSSLPQDQVSVTSTATSSVPAPTPTSLAAASMPIGPDTAAALHDILRAFTATMQLQHTATGTEDDTQADNSIVPEATVDSTTPQDSPDASS
eukprot:gene1774-3434_t